MFIRLPTPKGDYCVNLAKVLFFYPNKECTRFEMEDGTIIDFKLNIDDVLILLSEVGFQVAHYVKDEEK